MVKIGIIQMKMLKDQAVNLRKAIQLIDEAAKKDAQIVCLPELFNSLYFPQQQQSDAIAESIPGKTTSALSDAARKNKIVLVGGSIYEHDAEKKFNTSVVFDQNGEMLGKYRKVHIPNDPGFYEQNYFNSGSEYHVFSTTHGKVGVLICFDQWFPEPARILKLQGADIIFYPTAIATVKGVDQSEGNWQKAWEYVQRGHAISNSVVIAAVNRVGQEDDMNFWGGSFIYDQFGKLLLRANESEGVFLTSCDYSLSKNIEKGWGFLRSRKPNTYSSLVE